MNIDPDVKAIAHYFGIDAQLIQAVVNAEGNIVKAVQCSVPTVKDRAEALDVLCRSAVHAMSDWVKQDPERMKGVVSFFGNRWAPPNVANDPNHLNANWIPNVTAGWRAA